MRPPHPVYTADYATHVEVITWFLDSLCHFSVHYMALVGEDLGRTWDSGSDLALLLVRSSTFFSFVKAHDFALVTIITGFFVRRRMNASVQRAFSVSRPSTCARGEHGCC